MVKIEIQHEHRHTHPNKQRYGKDGGGSGLGPKESYQDCVVAEYIWLDAKGIYLYNYRFNINIIS